MVLRLKQDRVLSVPEVAIRLKVSDRRVRYLLIHKRLIGIRLGRQWVVKAPDLIAYAKTRDAKARRWEKARRARGPGPRQRRKPVPASAR